MFAAKRGRALAVCAALSGLASPVDAAPLPPGTPAPDFARLDLSGKPVSLAAWRGKPVLVDFWASWCAPCIAEIPHLIALQKKLDGRLKIVGISMDDDRASARDVATRYPFNYPLAMGDAALGKRYGEVLGLPALFLIGRDGRVLKSWRGEIAPALLAKDVEAAAR